MDCHTVGKGGGEEEAILQVAYKAIIWLRHSQFEITTTQSQDRENEKN